MSFTRRTLVGAALIVAATPLAALAQKLDKQDRAWLEHHRPLMLPDEEKAFRDLKDKGDREEFKKIFWARRDPDLETPENEAQVEYEKAFAEAHKKFTGVGRAGANSDCGRIYILLGPPDEVKAADGGAAPAGRGPEIWTFRDRPSMKFQGGQVQIEFDENCQLPQGARLGEQLNRISEGRIVKPDLNYRKGSDGKIVKLADQLPKPTPAVALLKAPRQDFPVAAEANMFLRTTGGTYLAGLVHAPAGAIAAQDAGGKKVAKVDVAVQAVDEAGKVAGVREREANALARDDGSLVASYGLALRPGKYTINVAMHDPATKKGSVASFPLEVPEFSAGEELNLAPLLALVDIQEGQSADPRDAFADFTLGTTRLVPVYGNVFPQSGTITLLSVIYDPPKDPATGKPSVTASFTIEKDGRPVARAEDQVYDSDSPTPSVGPVPLEKYGPGTYVAKLKVRDNVTKKDYTRESKFEVKAAGTN
jgi:GWxTD domain-containing protein